MATNPNFDVRPATPSDVPAINEILTHYALNTVMTFATSTQSDSTLAAKLQSITSEHKLPFFVATSQSSFNPRTRDEDPHAVIGLCYVSPYRPERMAYCHTGEISLFVHHQHHGRGIGSGLLRTVLEVTRKTSITEVLAIMAVDEDGKGKGLALRDYYKSWGFREVGTLEKVGFKFGRWIDVITLQLHVDGV